jgi:hypothetical protein
LSSAATKFNELFCDEKASICFLNGFRFYLSSNNMIMQENRSVIPIGFGFFHVFLGYQLPLVLSGF